MDPLSIESVSIELERYDNEGARWVVLQAEAELVERYGLVVEGNHPLTAADFDPPAGAFLVARAPGHTKPLGGVGLRPVGPGLGEIKRLWVDHQVRGQGIAKALMAEAESVAASLNMDRLRLETGTLQPEAVALYAALGWEQQVIGWTGGPIRSGSIHFAKELACP